MIVNGRYHISSETIRFLLKLSWIVRTLLEVYRFDTTVIANRVIDTTREINRSRRKGEEVKYGDNFSKRGKRVSAELRVSLLLLLDVHQMCENG